MVLGKTMIAANRALFNPVYRTFTWRVPPYATVVVADPETGDAYPVPVGAYPHADGTMTIPMSYGRDVTWVRNLVAAGGAQVYYAGQGRIYVNPRWVPAHEAYVHMAAPATLPYRAFGTEEFLYLDLVRE